MPCQCSDKMTVTGVGCEPFHESSIWEGCWKGLTSICHSLDQCPKTVTNIWKFILTKMCTSVIGFKLTYLERSLPSPGRCQVGRGDPCISLPFSCGTGCRKVKGSCSTDLGSNKPETKHKTKHKTKQSKTKQSKTKQNKIKPSITPCIHMPNRPMTTAVLSIARIPTCLMAMSCCRLGSPWLGQRKKGSGLGRDDGMPKRLQMWNNKVDRSGQMETTLMLQRWNDVQYFPASNHDHSQCWCLESCHERTAEL